MSAKENALFVGATGVSVSAPSGSSSASTTMPTNAAGEYPKYVRVITTAGTVAFNWDRSKSGSATAAATDLPVSVSDSQVVCTNYAQKFAVYGIGGASTVIVTPLEDSK